MVDVAGDVCGVVSAVLEVGKWLAGPIWRPCKYLYNYTTNFKNLEMEVDKLKSTREEVERKIIAAERNVEVINQNVKTWQDAAQKMIDKAEQLIQEKANNPRCFKGLCSNFIIRCKQSRKAFKLKRDDIAPLLQQERELSPVSYQTNPPEIWLRSSENYLAFESRNSTVKNVWDALNDENVFMIGVYGMGGLGKTTLVQEVGRKAEKEKLFDDIVFVEVSESPEIKKIQTVIADNLGLKFENETERAKKLYSRMEGKNILLILDNIWEPLEFENTIGIPCGVDRGRNKLLFTSRNLDVLEKMGSTNNFGMRILNENEAWNLFTKMAGNVIQTHRLHSLPNDVCKECRGLPIVICTIGKALKNKSNLSDWNAALQELKAPSPTNFIGLLEKEYMKIALSYKYLRNDELKKTFLIASLLENNSSISDLFKHVVCLDILEGANLTMENARHRLDTLVRELKDACLLLDGFESRQFAMHDVIRVVALTIAYVDHHVFTTRNDVERDWKDKDKLKKCTKIFLPSNSNIISQLWSNYLDCPNLEYFYMTNMWNSFFEIPEDFFAMMPKLRVLNVVRLRQSLLPSSIGLLTNLQTLCLDDSKIKDVVVIGKLKKLKVLSLRGSCIEEFPTEMSQLTQLRLLDLSNCYRLKVIAPNVISKLSNLEELYLKRCPIQWKIEELEDLELLLNLTSVELDIKDDKVLPKAFFSRELIRYKILVGSWSFPYSRIGGQECSRILKLTYNSTICLEELCGIKNVELLCLAEYLDDHDEDDEDEDEDSLEHSKFNLQSNEITPLFNKKVIFPDLMVLMLKNIISRNIWDSQLPSPSFQNLKELILWRCTKIKFVFPYTITKNLQQLQYLKIKDCIDLEEIVATEEITEAAASVVFPQVTFLKLKNLPELATFYPGIHTLEWPKLEKLAVEDCDKFKMFNLEPNSLCLDHKINHDLEVFELKTKSMRITWSRQSNALKILHDKSAYTFFQTFQSLELRDCEYKEIKGAFDLPNLNVLLVSLLPSSASLQNLKVLMVYGCNELVNLTTPSIARSLVQLKELSISNCGMLTEILENDGDETIEIVFKNLNKLSLEWLESLTCFCSGKHSLNFPSLEELIITNCPNMDTFFREISNVSEFTLQSNEITPFFNQKVYFRDLKVLKLENVSLEKIWDSQLSTSSYQNLTHLTLFGCDKIKYVFPLSIAKSLRQLQYLALTRCKVLERIVAPEEGTEAAINFFFPQVTNVELCNLPEFTDFYPGIHTSEWPKLRELVVEDCPKFKMFTSELNCLCFDQKINHDLEVFELKTQSTLISWTRGNKALEISSDESTYNPLPLFQRFQSLEKLQLRGCEYKEIKSVFDLPNLNVLHVQKCSKLVSLVPSSPSIARSLVQLKELRISNCGMLAEILENKRDVTTIEIIFQKLTKLSLDSLESLTCFCSGNHSLNLPSLEELIITKCPNMNTFFREISNVSEFTLQSNEITPFFSQKVIFLDLKVLELKNISFEKIWDNQLSTSSYQNLTHLTLFRCDKVKYVFPLLIAKSLQQLQYLKLTSCKVLERIIALEEGTEATINFFFPQVCTVKLQYLPKFTDLHTSKWPKLKELVVIDCSKFKMFTSEPNSLCFNQKINHDLKILQLQNGREKISWWSHSKNLEIFYYKSMSIPLWLFQRFENLTCLFVYSCHKLVNLTTPSTARSLVQLKELKISHCKILMEILEIEEDATIEIVFENLSKLSFDSIESLICFCSGNYTFNFPSLEELNIKNCPNMITFCRGILSTPKLQKISYEEMEVENEENDLNKTIQGLYKKKNQDISLDLNLKIKTFRQDNSIEIGYNQYPTSFYQNLTHLILCDCDNIKYAFPSSIAKSLHQLQQLKIQNCKVLKEIVAKEEGANAVVDFVFPNITLLMLEDLPELIAFYPGIYTLEMPKLKELVVKDCTKYVSLKENNVETELNILAPKSIFLDNKINFNLELFELDDGETNICWQSQSKTLTIFEDNSANIPPRLLQRFENVRQLQLFDSRYKDLKNPYDLPNLEVLEVCSCCKLMTPVSFSASFQNLKVLKIDSCDKLLKLITPSMPRSLVQLRELSITFCDMLIEIVENERDATMSVEIAFNNLNKLSLVHLQNLTCFCSENYSFSFPSLKELIIEYCPNLEIFCQGSLSTPNLDRVIYNAKEVENGENSLNTTIQQEHKKQKELTGSSEGEEED